MVVTKLQPRHRLKVQIQKQIRQENHQLMKNSSIYSANQSKRMTHRLKKKVILVENPAVNQNRSRNNLLRAPAKNLVIAEVSLPIVQVVTVTKVPVNHLPIHLIVGIPHQKVQLRLLPRAKKAMIKTKLPPRKKRNWRKNRNKNVWNVKKRNARKRNGKKKKNRNARKRNYKKKKELVSSLSYAYISINFWRFLTPLSLFSLSSILLDKLI